MSAPEEAIIEFDIELTAKASDEIKAALAETKAAKEGKEKEAEEPQDLAKDLLEEEGVKDDELAEFLTNVKEGDIKQFGQLAKSPGSFISGQLTKLLGAGGAAIIGPIALAIATPIVMAEIIKALSVKGGPFNRDWRRFIAAEVEVGLSRVQQKEKELGISQVILTQVVGFTPNNANWTYNSLFNIDDTRFARIGLDDRSAGVLVQ